MKFSSNVIIGLGICLLGVEAFQKPERLDIGSFQRKPGGNSENSPPPFFKEQEPAPKAPFPDIEFDTTDPVRFGLIQVKNFHFEFYNPNL